MSDSDDLLWLQATRLVTGGLAPEEAARVRAWICATEAGQVILRQAEATWDSAAALATVPPVAWDTAGAMRRFEEARAFEVRSRAAPVPLTATRVSRSRAASLWQAWRRPLATAATLTVFVLGGTSWLRRSSTAATGTTASDALAATAATTPRVVMLADRSQVTLAPGSTVRAAPGFGTTHRQLALEGEASFRVAPGTLPFQVRTRGVVVEDVSTAFVVRGQEADALVAVVEGAVVVGARRDTLRAGNGGVVGGAGLLAPLPPSLFRSVTEGPRGVLVFADEPLAEVAQRVSRWTGYTLEVDRDLGAHRITATFAGESPQTIIDVLATIVGASVDSTSSGWRLRRALR
ncbi:FecR domain-containing protein [Gemmatimonas sp.]|uniref:FecR domain-containing protein n=1 Tax=Gemmatimonas sp. TaxID=1962908 RepID=UPI0022CACDF4|nr:FecR domain-containing protein [Gemmatimonas sp.]MCZ8203773.1 FecR domain-containing protein [Gemmatimonas sp.]